MPEGAKQLFLFTFCFYFMVAGFIYFSLLPKVDNIQDIVAPVLYLTINLNLLYTPSFFSS